MLVFTSYSSELYVHTAIAHSSMFVSSVDSSVVAESLVFPPLPLVYAHHTLLQLPHLPLYSYDHCSLIKILHLHDYDYGHFICSCYYLSFLVQLFVLHGIYNYLPLQFSIVFFVVMSNSTPKPSPRCLHLLSVYSTQSLSTSWRSCLESFWSTLSWAADSYACCRDHTPSFFTRSLGAP